MSDFLMNPFIYGLTELPTPLFLSDKKEPPKCENPKGYDEGCLDCPYQYHYDMEEHCKNCRFDPMDI